MNLTYQALLDMRDALMPPLIYAVHEHVEAGKAYQMKASDLGPEFFIFHSREEAQAVARKAGCRLVHIRDWRKKKP